MKNSSLWSMILTTACLFALGPQGHVFGQAAEETPPAKKSKLDAPEEEAPPPKKSKLDSPTEDEAPPKKKSKLDTAEEEETPPKKPAKPAAPGEEAPPTRKTPSALSSDSTSEDEEGQQRVCD